MNLLTPIFNLVSPSGANARLSVLIFHRVLQEPDPLFPSEMDARRFDKLCSWLASWFNVLALDEAVKRMKGGTLPARAACITFDDGYADNHDVALPILRRHNMTATFFIATGYLNGGRMWNDTIIESVRYCKLPALDLSSLGLGHHELGSIARKRTAIEFLINKIKYRQLEERIIITERLVDLSKVQLTQDLMMTSEQLKTMRLAGMQIGAHTVSHPILARLTNEQARQEILDSKNFLEQLLGERISLFAYPNGKPGEDYTLQNVELVKSLDFNVAVSTQWGTSGTGHDQFQIRRYTPWHPNKLRFAAQLLSNLYSS